MTPLSIQDGTPSGQCALGRKAEETSPIGSYLESRDLRA